MVIEFASPLGVVKLKKKYATGTVTKSKITQRGYNRFLKVTGGDKITVTVDEEMVADDAKWDGLKGYVSNATLTPLGDCRSLPLALQRGAVVQDLKVQAGDTPDIPLQRRQDQGSHQHLLCRPEGLSGAGQDAEEQQDEAECGHRAEHCQNHPDRQCENGRKHLDEDPVPHQMAGANQAPVRGKILGDANFL